MKMLATVLVLTLFTTLDAVNQQQVNPYDPGICTADKRGKFVVVKDYNDDDNIVACVQHDGKYQWDMINGHSYGNYFDPAKDCSAVVDNVPKAKSGPYWIQTRNGPQKSWCDVETDRGGFSLIGVKDTPETWAIPSNASFIHPHGEPMWSSAFGEQEILDFRVQISTSKDFRDTRAQWYYRFKSPRILSELLMSNKGGCSHRYPGIGDVAFVKDLMTGEIATRNFKCSRFGSAIAPGLGWSKMNRCFKQDCTDGFAYILNHHIDTSGSYSYSVLSERSGIQDKQTSFIGCDHGECCACFGPDSKKDYCAPRCQAINGGTILKKEDNITVWFWIRSSLPKRVWKKCMEFKERNNAGKLETWRVEDGLRRKGPCSYGEDVTINDGVAVVPDAQSMNKLPKIEGLLSYRSDDREMYFKERSRWKALATQQDIEGVIGRLTRLESFKRAVESFKRVTNNKFASVTKDVNVLTHSSCKQIWMSQSNRGSGVYQIIVGRNQLMNVYCRMSSISGCSGGGWTMVMKIDGSQSTFEYSSSHWTNKITFSDNFYGRIGGFDNREFKGSTYWKTSFNEICVAMKYGGQLRALSFSYPASSLYDLIADGDYRQTHVGRSQWKQLIQGSSLQRNCNREGLNVFYSGATVKVRLGIIANQQNDCRTPDSFIGLGGNERPWVCSKILSSYNIAGNVASCSPDNGDKNLKAMGYILVR
ncbi:uncharacterized protein LOC114534527 [Dendronephthya gigantea]|uniref:uncharacterized protein LOC114534527 n=1 Tax=Dendronephthya gigantea TaxID=151771 RepID=UPI00106B9047|nr:uncharacterized protein LOC114534527 [Dendronephthya gigantea]